MQVLHIYTVYTRIASLATVKPCVTIDPICGWLSFIIIIRGWLSFFSFPLGSLFATFVGSLT